MNRVLTCNCPAKVNLALSVGRPNNAGMHPICSWMARVDFGDTLRIERVEGDSSFEIAWADDAPQPSPIDWPVATDLIVRAHRLVELYTCDTLAVRATLHKRIPVGAGLGGGSSDAAAMLVALNELFALGMAQAQLVTLAMKLGSDVAFFLGPPSAIVTGLGETITPAPLAGPIEATLILPPLRCNTGAVYRRFDERHPEAALREDDVASLVCDPSAGGLFNDLAEAACAVEPRLGELRRRIEQRIGRAVHITGSGAAMFVVGPPIADSLDVPTVRVKTV